MTHKTPLIVRLPNWLGDVIMTLPSLEALRSAGFDLTLLGKPWILDLLHAFPAKLLPLPSSLLQAHQTLNHNLVNNALLFTNSVSSALIMRLAKKQVIGYKNSIRNRLLTKSIAKTPHLHEVEYFWKIAELAARTWLPRSSWPQSIPNHITLPLSDTSKIKIAERLKKEAIVTPFVVLCPSATGTAKHGVPKIWPHWHNFSDSLVQQGVTCLVCPGPLEEEQCRKLTPNAKLLAGLNLSELAALFTHADFVVANDSGPMHLASATGADVLGIFGATDPHRTHPWGGNYIGELGQWPSVDTVLDACNKKFTKQS